MDKKILKFDLDSKNIKIKNILETKDFIKLEVWAISDVYPNNNNSHFPLHTMEKNVADGNFYDKPVLGKWNSLNGDLEVHNSQIKYDGEYDTVYFDYENGETPMGTIRQSDTVEIRDGKDGLKWVVFTAVLWTKYNYNVVKKLLRSKKKKVSVEVSVTKWHYDENEVEIFDEWIFDGVTILGNLPNTTVPAEAGIPDAHLTILEKIEDAVFNKQIKVVQFECNSLNQKEKQENLENKDDITSTNKVDLYKEENDKGATKLLTYEQKRSILEAKLNDLLNEIHEDEDSCGKEYIWVADLTDTDVFFCIEGVYYKAPYELKEEDEKIVAIIDVENKERQLRSWKEFSNEECEDCKDNCTLDCDEEEKECNLEGDTDGDKNVEEEPKEDQKENSSEDVEGQDGQDDDNCKMCDFKVEIEGKEFSGDELFEKYTSEVAELNSKIEEFSSNIENLEKEIEDKNEKIQSFEGKCKEYEETISNLNSTIKSIENEKLSKFAYDLAKESELEEDVCKDFCNKCLSGEYSSEEDVTKDIAFAVFKNTKKAKDNSTHVEEFSAKINNLEANTTTKKTNDVFAGCREIINN